jgi:DNA-binding protein Fis
MSQNTLNARSEVVEKHEIADVSGTLGQAAIPPCPPEYAKFVEETSLEKLVFWKLEKLVNNLSTDYIGTVELDVLDKVVTHVEKPLFALVLRKTSGNLSIAAKLLGCNRNTLHRKLREFEIVPKDLRKMLRKGRMQKLTQLP